jgi:hypothetical protein
MDSRICRIKDLWSAGILPASKIVLMSLMGLLSLAGCEKDDSQSKGRVRLTTEKHQSEEKTSVRNITVQWVNGDSIRLCYINESFEEVLDVKVSGSNAYVERFASKTGNIYAYYPYTIIGEYQGHTSTPTVTIPSRYDSHYSGGRQVLALPMVATGNSTDNLVEFKNLTAALMVVIDNLTGSPLMLDSVKVTSGTYKLSGTLPLNLAADGFGVAAQSGSGSVTVRFTDHPTLATSGYDTLQVPICPIGSGALQIQVYAHRQGDAISITGVPSVYKTVVYHYNDSKSVAALGRNVMMTARIALRTNSGDHTSTDTIDNSLFTINASGDKVRFSKGNLWYNGSSYAFHNYQYDRVGTTQTESKDLFQWVDFSTLVTGWAMLSATEWDYLLNTRSGCRFVKACVNSVNGLIIFPDTYHHPIAQALVKVNVSGSMSYSDNTFTSTQWGAMEGAGAIFLPAAGYLSGSTVGAYGAEGDYWSSTPDIEGKYKRLEFKSNEVTTANGAASSYGYSVRLVKSN